MSSRRGWHQQRQRGRRPYNISVQDVHRLEDPRERTFVELVQRQLDDHYPDGDGGDHFKTILVFPRLAARYRFLLHQFIDQRQPQTPEGRHHSCQLVCKSFGKDPLRFPVVFPATDPRPKQQMAESSPDRRADLNHHDRDHDNVADGPAQISPTSSPDAATSRDSIYTVNECDTYPTSPSPPQAGGGLTDQVGNKRETSKEYHQHDQHNPSKASNGRKRPDKQLYVPPPAKSDIGRSTPSPSSSSSSHPVGSHPKPSPAPDDVPPDTEESWDTLFDEDGECRREAELEAKLRTSLDLKCPSTISSSSPSLPSESLSPAAKMDVKFVPNREEYLQFAPPEIDLSDSGEFGHILEAFDFSSDLKERDLIMTLKTNRFVEFDIKWVDETHALVIFPSTQAAQGALAGHYGLLKLRPLSAGTRESKLKAKRSPEQMLPFKERPTTSASLARRLVSGHLGIRVPVSAEQKAAEESKKLRYKEKQKRIKDIKNAPDLWEDEKC